MRYIILLLMTICTISVSSAQIFTPVKWSFSEKKIGEGEYELTFKAKIDNGWFVYSQYLASQDGPVATTLNFDQNAQVQLLGKGKESGNKKTGHDETFKMTVTKFYKTYVIKQRVKVKGNTRVSGYVNYMTCNNQRCLPPYDEDFSFNLKAGGSTTPVATTPKPKPKPNPVKPKPGIYPPNHNNPPPSNPVVETTPQKSTRPANGLPVIWSFDSKRIGEKQYEILATADILDGWVLYSPGQRNSAGPSPTELRLDRTTSRFVDKKGRMRKVEGRGKRDYDNVFGMDLVHYSGIVTFSQKVETDQPRRYLNGAMSYMASNGTSSIPPYDANFSLKLNRKWDKPKEKEKEKEEPIVEVAKPQAPPPAPTTPQHTIVKPTDTEFVTAIDKTNAEFDCSGEQEDELSAANWWMIFLLGFGGGLIALLTPCVFPMIPITVGFFTKSSKNKRQGFINATIYGLSIVFIYVALGLTITGIFGADALNAMSTGAFFNLLFFAIFVIFAISFFGYFELTLPSSWSTGSDKIASRGGLIGIFFMAFTLSLVSFSCTGPIIGTLLVETATGGGATWSLFGLTDIPIKPLLGMSGFAIALALPFALFAAFPGWLNTLPKSGGWMTTVKVTLGFLELALALKFLSVVDLAYHWDFLKIELFLGIWMLIFLGLTAYLFGFIRFPHDAPLKSLSKGRFATGLASLGFVVYLGSGMFSYQPLHLLSGILPSVTYSYFNETDCPQNFNCFKDYEEGMKYAKAEGKPVMLDFTGYGCVNCRKMEETVWGETDVKKILSEDYVLISLYVDDKKKLEKPYEAIINGRTKRIRTVGNKWSLFQEEHFKSNSQPQYVLLTNDGEVLNKPVGYTPDGSEYVDFLECGLQQNKLQGISEK